MSALAFPTPLVSPPTEQACHSAEKVLRQQAIETAENAANYDYVLSAVAMYSALSVVGIISMDAAQALRNHCRAVFEARQYTTEA